MGKTVQLIDLLLDNDKSGVMCSLFSFLFFFQYTIYTSCSCELVII